MGFFANIIAALSAGFIKMMKDGTAEDSARRIYAQRLKRAARRGPNVTFDRKQSVPHNGGAYVYRQGRRIIRAARLNKPAIAESI